MDALLSALTVTPVTDNDVCLAGKAGGETSS